MRLKKVPLIAVIPAVMYLTAEVSFFVGLRFDWFRRLLDGVYFSRPASSYDSVRGYRWINSGFKGIRVAYGDLVYSTRFYSDGRGFAKTEGASSKLFSPPKFAVFGDSFTEGIYLDKNWMSRVNRSLKRMSEPPADLVSFAVDGGGLTNWAKLHDHFVKDKPEYQGAIFAVYNDNLTRDFSASESRDNKFFFARSSQLPSSRSVVRRGCPVAAITDEALIDWVENATLSKISFGSNTFNFIKTRIRQHPVASAKCAWDSITDGDADTLLEGMIASLKGNKQRVILTVVPGRESLIKYLESSEEPPIQNYLRTKSVTHGVEWVDGYRAFQQVKPPNMSATDFVNSKWLLHDGHWNQEGSDIFARAISEYLMGSRVSQNS